ncbi:MAG: hypothetical protein H7144_13795 [Burkholderiales bacterium]|nr:hypothetical protein [Phycisphaerae bacterium]
MQREFRTAFAPYLWAFFAFIGIGFIFHTLVDPDFWQDWFRPVFAAGLFGGLVGAAEIVSRYRDEPIRACYSPFGLIYLLCNAAMSVAALYLIVRLPESYGAIRSNRIIAAIAAGFGASVIMRTRLAVIRTADNKDVSIGPDIVTRLLLSVIDHKIDRYRALRRQRLVVATVPVMRELGSFRDAANYLTNSLLAFQNLDEALRSQLTVSVEAIDHENLPVDVKLLAMGFIFLSICGEAQFGEVTQNALGLIKTDTRAELIP